MKCAENGRIRRIKLLSAGHSAGNIFLGALYPMEGGRRVRHEYPTRKQKRENPRQQREEGVLISFIPGTVFYRCGKPIME